MIPIEAELVVKCALSGFNYSSLIGKKNKLLTRAYNTAETMIEKAGKGKITAKFRQCGDLKKI